MRRLKLLTISAIVVAACSIVATAFPASTSLSGKRAPAVHLRIGAVLSFTGPLSGFGPSLNQSARIATRRINETLRRQRLANRMSVRLFSEDGQTQAAASVEAATKLVNVNKVHVILGEMSSASTIPMAQSVTIPNRRVHIAPVATAAAITDLKDNGYVYRMLAPDQLQGRVLAAAIRRAFGRRAVVNVGARNDAFGTGLRQIFEREWRRSGGRIGQSVTWDPNAASLDSEAQQLVRGRPAAWVIIDFPQSFAKIAAPLVRTGSWDPRRTFVNEVMRNVDELNRLGGGALSGLRGTAPTSVGAPARAALDNLFRRQAPRGMRITGYEGTTFDAVMISFLSAVKARSTRPALIKRHLRAISGPPGRKYTFLNLGAAIKAVRRGKDINYEGAWGPVDWDAKGDPGAAVFEVWRYANNSISTVSRFTFR